MNTNVINAGKKKSNVAIDITKIIMAVLVIAIHTEPFGFSFILDKGFGLFTRFCVPFFFVTSSYFFFINKNNNPFKYIKRLFILYFIWSIIYLPLDIPYLKTRSLVQILVRYFWSGNGHALWYLCGSIIGFIIVFALSKLMKPKTILIVSVLFLIVGCLKSTYAPAIERIFPVTISDFLGSRNGLFYAFPYYAVGLYFAENDERYSKASIINVVGVVVSFVLLCIESVVMVMYFKTDKTILWLSVLPLTYNFFIIVKNAKIPLSGKISVFLRKLSTLVYVSHCLYQYFFESVLKLKYWESFLAVLVTVMLVSSLVIFLSDKRPFRWLKVFY